MTVEAPLILGFDTSGPHCAAALLRGDQVICERLELMTRGQAERIMVLLEEVLSEGGVTWHDLTAIGVGVGPGNFTGIRISVSAARGLALGLGIPAVGVSGIAARAHLAPDGHTAAVPAPREQVYVDAENGPELIGLDVAEARFGPIWAEPSPDGIAHVIAQAAADQWQTVTTPPAPLYLRAADAAPSRDVPPELID